MAKGLLKLKFGLPAGKDKRHGEASLLRWDVPYNSFQFQDQDRQVIGDSGPEQEKVYVKEM